MSRRGVSCEVVFILRCICDVKSWKDMKNIFLQGGFGSSAFSTSRTVFSAFFFLILHCHFHPPFFFTRVSTLTHTHIHRQLPAGENNAVFPIFSPFVFCVPFVLHHQRHHHHHHYQKEEEKTAPAAPAANTTTCHHLHHRRQV